MPNTLTGNLSIGIAWEQQKPLAGMPATVASNSLAKRIAWQTGAGLNQCDELYAAVRTLLAGSNETLDLAAGGLVNPVGDASITFARIKGMRIYLLGTADTASDGVTVGTACSGITLGGSGSTFLGPLGGTTPSFTLQNGMVFGWGTPTSAGFPVGAGSTDTLKVTNNDGAVAAVYEIVLFGSKT
jgi:hypothetical protein